MINTNDTLHERDRNAGNAVLVMCPGRKANHTSVERFVRPEHRRLVLADASIDAVLDAMECWRPPPVPRWIDLDRS